MTLVERLRNPTWESDGPITEDKPAKLNVARTRADMEEAAMALHYSTFGYLLPTADQKDSMTIVREAATEYAQALEMLVPDGPDKTYLLRKLREVAMWANIAITRDADGFPRGE